MSKLTEQELINLIRPVPRAKYEVDVGVAYIEKWIHNFNQDYGGLELDPDYQRGHVWTEYQQIRFVENVIRGAITSAGLLIQFNCARFETPLLPYGDLPQHIQCVDGLQRLTAMRRFMSGDLTVFGGLRRDDLDGSSFDLRRYRMKFAIHEFKTRSELLQYYLDWNDGGTQHDPAEIERVRGLKAEADAYLCSHCRT